ncbi:MAG: baseplate J/gp47 family protein [Clostridiales Family XIII bacterium]|jgi:hypothetical protein|nr:baseplate J/gp47 family protein [Clostridiales Family XIII bacterium]
MADTEAKQYILNDIARRAPLYAPEWRYNPASPDAGAALAFLWADMFAGTLERFRALPDNYRRAFLDAIGSEPRPAVPARAWLAFRIREDATEVVIPKATEVSASAAPDLALVTDRELAASPAKITDVFCVVPARDAVVRYDGLAGLELFRAAAGDGHILTFTHPFAFDVSDRATLRLVPELSAGTPDALAELAWEYLDGEDWRKLRAVRDGEALRFAFPADKKNPCAVLRVKADVASAGALTLLSLTARPSGFNLFPDALYTGDAQADDVFYPFGRRFLPGGCAYFACTDALAKPGARVELSFAADYEDFEAEGYPDREIRLRRMMRVSDFEEPKRFAITAAEVKWEYWNGVGWASLGANQSADVFNGDAPGRVKITFDCPADLQPALVGAHDLPFVRARLITANNLYCRPGYYRAPIVSDVRFAYRFAVGAAVTSVGVSEHLDAREANFPMKLASEPDGPAALYFAFDRRFTQGTILFDMAPDAEPPALRWEYLTESGWTALNVRDNTAGLRKTGILSYETLRPAASARLWGKEAHWIRVACEGRAYTGAGTRRPRLRGLYENAVRAAASVPGEASRLPAGAFATLNLPIPGVIGAENPVAAYGGADTEDEDRIVARLTAAISHFGRAISAGDVEALALEASLGVLRARCYAHTDANGNTAYGESALVLQPKGAEESGFAALRDEVRAYVEAGRALGAGILHIVPPQYITVRASVVVAVDNPDEALSVKYRINEALAEFLTPTGWAIGSLPSPGRIETAIRAVSGVLYLVKIKTAYIRRGIACDYARAVSETFVLPVNGRHDIAFA